MGKDFSHWSLLDVKYTNKLAVTLSGESFKIELEEFYWRCIYITRLWEEAFVYVVGFLSFVIWNSWYILNALSNCKILQWKKQTSCTFYLIFGNRKNNRYFGSLLAFILVHASNPKQLLWSLVSYLSGNASLCTYIMNPLSYIDMLISKNTC